MMKEIKKIRAWLRDTFLTDYVIARREVMAWMVYPAGGHFKKVHVYSPTDIFAKDEGGLTKHYFTRHLNYGHKMKKLIAILWLKWLRKKYNKKVVFTMLPISKAIFITDMTGLSAN